MLLSFLNNSISLVATCLIYYCFRFSFCCKKLIFLDPPSPIVTLKQPNNGDKFSSLNVSWKIPFSNYNISKYALNFHGLHEASLLKEINITDQTFFLFENLIPGNIYQVSMKSISSYGDAPERKSATAESNQQRTSIVQMFCVIIRISLSIYFARDLWKTMLDIMH